MEPGLSVAPQGEGDDLTLRVTVALPPDRHAGTVYVGEDGLSSQAAALQRFLAQLFDPAPASSITLKFGWCSIDIGMLRLGKARVSVHLEQPYQDSNFEDMASCTMHFSTTIGLLDRFATELAAVAGSPGGTATLEPSEYHPYRE